MALWLKMGVEFNQVHIMMLSLVGSGVNEKADSIKSSIAIKVVSTVIIHH